MVVLDMSVVNKLLCVSLDLFLLFAM